MDRWKIDNEALFAAISADPARLASVVGLRRAGDGYLCPFCQRADNLNVSPRFSIYDGFRCHKCGWQGDGIRLAVDMLPWSYGYAQNLLKEHYEVGSRDDLPRLCKTDRNFFTSEVAAEAKILWMLSKQSIDTYTLTAQWPYKDSNGRIVARVLRVDASPRVEAPQAIKPTKYVAISRWVNTWCTGEPEGKWPLYRLPDILGGDVPIFVCGSERSCDAGRDVGLVCTTSAHGIRLLSKSDWKPLAGRNVVLVQESNARSSDCTTKLWRYLKRLHPPVRLRVLGIPPLGDFFDFLERRKKRDPQSVMAEILGTAFPSIRSEGVLTPR